MGTVSHMSTSDREIYKEDTKGDRRELFCFIRVQSEKSISNAI